MSVVKLKALSLWQPWASLLVHGEKKIETRSWSPPPSMKLPFTLAIHASKVFGYEQRIMCADEPFNSSITKFGYAWFKNHSMRLKHLPLGALVGTVEIYDVQMAQERGMLYSEKTDKFTAIDVKERQFGDFTPGRFGWLARNFNPFKEPIPMIGRQGIFNVEINEALLYKGEISEA